MMQNATLLDGISYETTPQDIPLMKSLQEMSLHDAALWTGLKLIFVPCILILNAFVLVVYCKFPKIRAQPHNVFIIALAITDFATGLMTIPMGIFNHISPNFYDPNTPMPWYFRNKALCVFNYFSVMQPLQWSSTTLVIIAMDRFVATFFPLKYYVVMTRARSVYAVVIGWIVSSIPIYTTLAIVDQETYNPRKLCKPIDHIPPALEKAMFYMWSAIPVAISVAIYVTIGVKLHRQTNQVENQRQQTVTMAVVIAAFIVCLLPVSVILQRPTTLSRAEFLIAVNVASSLAYLNSCINPIIYNMFNPTFRKCSRQLLCCWRNQPSKNWVQHTEMVDDNKL